MQVGTRVGRMFGIAWILGQTLLLGVADAVTFSVRGAWLLLPPYLGLQLVAFFVFNAMAQESAARAALAVSNAELRGVGRILADSSRMAERLRIGVEWTDALGHHLTALSLNLEAALQLTQGAAHASVATAQSLARRLLSDVREIVAESRPGRRGCRRCPAYARCRRPASAHPSRHPAGLADRRPRTCPHTAALCPGDGDQRGAALERR